jgi:hypothetical protein
LLPPHNLTRVTLSSDPEGAPKLLIQVSNSPRSPPEMTSQLLIQEYEYEQESAVEMPQSRWGSSSQTFVDRPPSQPLGLRQMSERPSSSPVTEKYHTDPDTGNSRRGNATARDLRRQTTVATARPPTNERKTKQQPSNREIPHGSRYR